MVNILISNYIRRRLSISYASLDPAQQKDDAMTVLKLIGIITLTVMALYCIKRIIIAILNLHALSQYRRTPDPINQRQGIVYNKRTNKLEADQSPILPYE